jgi:Bacterial SH3 domain
MALIPCSKCGKQISSLAKECPACGTPPQISTVPPPLPAETAHAKGTNPDVLRVALLIAFVLAAVSVYNVVVKRPESSGPSAAPSTMPIPAATPENFPRAIPVQTPTAFGADVARATPASVTYRVIKISKGDYLNVRTGAGSKYPVVMRLEPGTGGIVLGANRVANAETKWQEIIVNGRTGWVNADYIAPATQSSASP